MPDEHGNLTDADCVAFIEKADKTTLWWGMFRLLSALHSARACDPDCAGKPEDRGGLYTVAHMTADHWGPQIPGMPDFSEVAREIAEDEAYHNLTYAAESMGLRITGDEFIERK